MNSLINSIIKIFWPVYLPLIAVIILSIMSEEIYYFPNKLDLQKSDTLFGSAFSNFTIEHHAYRVINNKPRTIIIGTSRVNEFRSESFGENTYIAGGIISQIGQLNVLFEYFIENNYLPERVIIGLDQNFFNPLWDEVLISDSENYRSRLLNRPGVVFPNPQSIVSNFPSDPLFMFDEKFLGSRNIGLYGKLYNHGFRLDGHYFRESLENRQYNNDGFSKTIGLINKGSSGFQYSEYYNQNAIDELSRFLNFAKERNIEIIAFMPPYAPTINEVMISTGNYKYISKVSDRLIELFLEFGFDFFDFTSFETATDNDFLDGFHGDFKLYNEIALLIN